MGLEGSRVAVVGGGLGGLTAARLLAVHGADPEVLEAGGRAGGVVGTLSIDGYRCELAANGALSSAVDGMIDLAAELGIETQPASPAVKNRWIYVGGKLRALPTGPRSLITTDLLSPAAKLRLLGEPLRPAQRGDVTIADFFRHRLGDEVHDRVVAPFVTGVFAGDTERLSLSASFPRLAELASHGSLLRGLLASRRKGKSGPGRVHAPVGGMGELVRALAVELGNRVRLEAPVAAIAGRLGGVEVTMASGVQTQYDAAVLALPAHAAAKLVSDVDGELASVLKTIETVPVAVVHLGYRLDQIDGPTDGFGFLVAPSESLPILGAVFESQLWPARAPDGSILIRVMIGGARRPELVDRDDAELIATATETLATVLGVRGEPELVNVARWPSAIAQYTVGHAQRVERADALAAAQNTVLAGASYRGVAVNALCADASRVVRSVAQLMAMPLALLLVVCASAWSFGCSGAGVSKQNNGRDGGDGSGQVDHPDNPNALPGPIPGYEVLEGELPGVVVVSVKLDTPEAAWVTSPGADGCGHSRRAPLVVDTHGGVRDAAVWIEGIESGVAPPPRFARRAIVADCAVRPRVLALPRPGATLEIASASESRVELVVARDGTSPSAVIAALPMAPVGRVFAIDLERAGVYAISGDAVEPAWAVVSAAPYLGITDGAGRVRLTELPVGTFTVRVWHPPVVPGGEPLSSATEVEVTGDKPASVEVALR